MNMHDVYRPFQVHFRRRRMAQFVDLFRVRPTDRILDVGGYEFNWSLIDVKPQVLMVNLEHEEWTRDHLEKRHGDGRALPFDDLTFDIAYSNSVIEHVGGRDDQEKFAQEIRRVARRYYVQTPNKNFVVEPHLMAPLIHWLPSSVGRRLVRNFSVWGWMNRPSLEEVDSFVGDIELLDRADMERLFPDATILEERVLGLTKSLIAVKA